jgi:hypothetical protein
MFVTTDRVYGLKAQTPQEARLERADNVRQLQARAGDFRGWEGIRATEDTMTFADFASAKKRFASEYYGRHVDGWRTVPDEVGRSLGETVAWLVEAAASSPGP